MQAIESFEVPTPPKVNYINAQYGLKSWLLTRDHKRIALLYLASITFFFFIGGIYAMMIRLELLTPQGDLLQSTTYNKVFTQHGIIMVFFFLIPSIPATLGNFLIPMMILTGLTMAPSFNATFPQLLWLFGGRQSARSLHFLCAMGLLAFIVVHLVMVVLAGPINEIRSMITGWFRTPPEKQRHG